MVQVISEINEAKMANHHFIIIREYKASDSPAVSEVVRNAYLQNVNTAWLSTILKEITFQLIVSVAAIMFIFLGFPLLLCLAAIPIVLAIIYLVTYSAVLMKAAEVVYNKRPIVCWIAEAYEPYFFSQKPQDTSYRILSEEAFWKQKIDFNSFQRKIIGTVAVSNSQATENAAWLFRLAVDKRYTKKGIGRSLIETAKKWCRDNRYSGIEFALSEFQEKYRKLFTNSGFNLKQMYHKQLLGSALVYQMYNFELELKK